MEIIEGINIEIHEQKHIKNTINRCFYCIEDIKNIKKVCKKCNTHCCDDCLIVYRNAKIKENKPITCPTCNKKFAITIQKNITIERKTNCDLFKFFLIFITSKLYILSKYALLFYLHVVDIKRIEHFNTGNLMIFVYAIVMLFEFFFFTCEFYYPLKRKNILITATKKERHYIQYFTFIGIPISTYEYVKQKLNSRVTAQTTMLKFVCAYNTDLLFYNDSFFVYKKQWWSDITTSLLLIFAIINYYLSQSVTVIKLSSGASYIILVLLFLAIIGVIVGIFGIFYILRKCLSCISEYSTVVGSCIKEAYNNCKQSISKGCCVDQATEISVDVSVTFNDNV